MTRAHWKWSIPFGSRPGSLAEVGGQPQHDLLPEGIAVLEELLHRRLVPDDHRLLDLARSESLKTLPLMRRMPWASKYSVVTELNLDPLRDLFPPSSHRSGRG